MRRSGIIIIIITILSHFLRGVLLGRHVSILEEGLLLLGHSRGSSSLSHLRGQLLLLLSRQNGLFSRRVVVMVAVMAVMVLMAGEGDWEDDLLLEELLVVGLRLDVRINAALALMVVVRDEVRVEICRVGVVRQVRGLRERRRASSGAPHG